jgi:endo-1,4-beta-D-glucanase Y
MRLYEKIRITKEEWDKLSLYQQRRLDPTFISEVKNEEIPQKQEVVVEKKVEKPVEKVAVLEKVKEVIKKVKKK